MVVEVIVVVVVIVVIVVVAVCFGKLISDQELVGATSGVDEGRTFF